MFFSLTAVNHGSPQDAFENNMPGASTGIITCIHDNGVQNQFY